MPGVELFPKQLVVRATRGRNKVTDLPHGASLLDLRSALPRSQDRKTVEDDKDHGNRYRELFAPVVASGLLKSSDLAGYGTGHAFNRKSMHFPAAISCPLPIFWLAWIRYHPFRSNREASGRFGTTLLFVIVAWSSATTP